MDDSKHPKGLIVLVELQDHGRLQTTDTFDTMTTQERKLKR